MNVSNSNNDRDASGGCNETALDELAAGEHIICPRIELRKKFHTLKLLLFLRHTATMSRDNYMSNTNVNRNAIANTVHHRRRRRRLRSPQQPQRSSRQHIAPSETLLSNGAALYSHAHNSPLIDSLTKRQSPLRRARRCLATARRCTRPATRRRESRCQTARYHDGVTHSKSCFALNCRRKQKQEQTSRRRS